MSAPGAIPHSATDFLGPEYFLRIARTLEYGKFHLGFFDDRLAMPDILGSDHREAVANGVRVVKMDPTTILACMGMATSNLGLGSTYSTTYYEPFHVARVFATLDLMIERAAPPGTSSRRSTIPKRRTSRSRSTPSTTCATTRPTSSWRSFTATGISWEDDAIVIDKETGLFAHPEKVHRLDHKGRWFRSKGPLHGAAQQAGPARRHPGRAVGARPEILGALGRAGVLRLPQHRHRQASNYTSFKDLVAGFGRDPDEVGVAPAIYVVVGETKAMAEDKMAVIDGLAKPVDGLALLSEALNFDFYSKPMDRPVQRRRVEGHLGPARRSSTASLPLSGKKNPTIRDFVQFSNRGTVREFPRFVGTREGRRRRARGMVQHLLRRLRRGGDSPSRRLRGLRTRWWCPSCSGAVCTRRTTKVRRCAITSGLPKAEIGDWKL